MLRVSKKLVALLLVIFSIILLLDQLYLYLQFSSTTSFQRSLSLEDVRVLLRTGEETGVSRIILFDPLILQAWRSNTYVETTGDVCVFLCHIIGPLTFAVMDGELRNKPLFLTRLRNAGFSLTNFENAEKKYSHVFLSRNGSPLHLLVLHSNPAGFWRQYALNGLPQDMSHVKQFITKDAWDQMKLDRAYDRFPSQDVIIDGVRVTVPTDITEFVKNFGRSQFVACNDTQAVTFRLKNEQNPDWLHLRHVNWKLLAKTKTILDAMEIPFWLTANTLMGFARQCDIIKSSHHINLGIHVEYYKPSIVENFEKHSVQLIRQLGWPEDSLEITFLEGNLELSLDFFYGDGGRMCHSRTNTETWHKYRFTFPNFTLCWTEFLDLKIRVPCDVHQYMSAMFGANWWEPHQWDLMTEPLNGKEYGVWNDQERQQFIVRW